MTAWLAGTNYTQTMRAQGSSKMLLATRHDGSCSQQAPLAVTAQPPHQPASPMLRPATSVKSLADRS